MGGNRHPDGVRADQASLDRLSLFRNAEKSLEDLSAPILLDESNLQQRLFVASFDGTGNSKRDPEKLTNIALVDEQFRGYARDAEDRLGFVPIHAGYVAGPGTQGGVSGLVDAAYGSSYQARIEDMYLQFVTQARTWLVENPDADIRILATGFSRGAEQAAGFTRLVEARGIQDPTNAVVKRDADGLIIGEVVYPNPPLRAPGSVVQAAVLLDPVGTGAPRQNDRRLAESFVSAFQITALDERRNLSGVSVGSSLSRQPQPQPQPQSCWTTAPNARCPGNPAARTDPAGSARRTPAPAATAPCPCAPRPRSCAQETTPTPGASPDVRCRRRRDRSN